MMPNSRDQGPEEDRRRGEFEASTIRAEVGVTEAGEEEGEEGRHESGAAPSLDLVNGDHRG